MKYLIFIFTILLFSSALFGIDKPCYVNLNSSKDFNQTLLSNISISVISQYLENVKIFPSSGLSGKGHCIYEVTATLEGKKTFVTLQGNNLNSFGNASILGTEGFQEAILRSIYRSQRDKRGLICSDYPKILEECGGVVKKSEEKKVVVSKVFEKQQLKSEVLKVNSKTKKDCSGMSKCIVGDCDWIPEHCKSKKKDTTPYNTKKPYVNDDGVEMCWFPKLRNFRDCDWKDRGRRTAEAVKRGIKECGGFMNWEWIDELHSKYRCN